MIHRRDFLKKGAICTGAAALGSQAAAEARGECAGLGRDGHERVPLRVVSLKMVAKLLTEYILTDWQMRFPAAGAPKTYIFPGFCK